MALIVKKRDYQQLWLLLQYWRAERHRQTDRCTLKWFLQVILRFSKRRWHLTNRHIWINTEQIYSIKYKWTSSTCNNSTGIWHCKHNFSYTISLFKDFALFSMSQSQRAFTALQSFLFQFTLQNVRVISLRFFHLPKYFNFKALSHFESWSLQHNLSCWV